MSWIDDFKRPVNALSLALAIFGTAFGFYTYLAAKKDSRISYSLSEIKVFDSKTSKSISVLGKDGTLIDLDVYAADLLMWNSGDLPIDSDLVRRPLRLSLQDPSGQIIDSEIVSQKHRDETGFSIDPVRSTPSQLVLKWIHFDPNDAFRIRVLYTSHQAQSIRVEGALLGVPEFVDAKLSLQDSNFLTRPEFTYPEFLFKILFLVPFLMLLIPLSILMGATMTYVLDGREKFSSYIDHFRFYCADQKPFILMNCFIYAIFILVVVPLLGYFWIVPDSQYPRI